MSESVPNFILQREDCSASEKAAARLGLSLIDGAMPPRIGPGLFDEAAINGLPAAWRVPLVRRSWGELREEAAWQVPPCPVGTVEFCRAWRRAVGVREPAPMDYPQPLMSFLGREVVLHEGADRPLAGCWVKPVQTKAWPAQRIGAGQSEPGPGPFWSSEHLDLLAEFRVYVLGRDVAGVGRYDDGPNDELGYDQAVVDAMIRAYSASGQAPAAYALDVGVLVDGRTVLVEVTDAWAIGYYRGTLSAKDYARLLWARWVELAGH
jgi:hypothetical protein